jgi:hypothetical protein
VGRPPFYSEDEQEIEKLTSIGKYTFPETPVISDDGFFFSLSLSLSRVTTSWTKVT